METNVEKKVERRNCNTSDASNSDIPEELQIDILSRLEPNALSRCKCVSKHWNDTLTMQAFLLRHSRSYDKHPKLGFVAGWSTWGKNRVLSFELNDDNTPKTAIMTATKPKTTACQIKLQGAFFSYFVMGHLHCISNICNDLICLFNPCLTHVCLLNLQTRDFIYLPGITTKSVEPFRFWYALGFDPVHKVFKVLRINNGGESKECTSTKAAILTVGSKYWNPIDNGSLPSSVVKNQPSWVATECTDILCFDGVLYRVHKNKNTIDNVTVHTVVAFDLNCEAFRDNNLVTTPMRDGTYKYYLTSLKECPTLLICKINNNDIVEVEQWTLFNHKDPNAAWNRRNITNHNFPKINPYNHALATTTAGGSALLQYSGTINSECWWYLWHDLENFAIE